MSVLDSTCQETVTLCGRYHQCHLLENHPGKQHRTIVVYRESDTGRTKAATISWEVDHGSRAAVPAGA